MFAVDSSTLVAFFAGETGSDIALFERVLNDGLILMVPTVVSEILSDPKLPSQHEKTILKIPQVPIELGFWERLGYLRRTLFKAKHKARLADAMIAQFCIDHALTLIARDRDYKVFQKYSSLKLA